MSVEVPMPPNKRPGYSGDNTFVISLVIASLLVGLVGAFCYWRYFPRTDQGRPSEYDSVYLALGIAPLPATIENRDQLRSRLDQLRREPCYRDAIYNLAQSLIKLGYPREAATSVRTFVARCRASESLLPVAYSALDRISDFQGALQVATELVRAYPARGDLRYSRAKAYDHLRDFPHALVDYINTIQLESDPKRLFGDVFYNVARMYVELGRYCDAITPMETYISLDPMNRRTPQTTKVISEFAEKGSCDAGFATGSARVSLPGQTNIKLLHVVINGVEGNFILDTGATFVSVTSQFAVRAAIPTESSNQIVMKTVGGTALAEIGSANIVRVDKAEARGVVVAVNKSTAAPFGDRIDGLLGMSFLARFNLSLSQSRIELAPIPLR
jgi:tetratricopeptide (TPR) repeat protein